MTEEVKAHSTLSASGAERWFNCPGSVKLCKDLPLLPTSKYAAEGTLAHSLLEYHLKLTLLNEETEKPKETTHDMEEAVEEALDYIVERFMFADRKNILIEHRFDLSFIFEGMFGTADFCGITEDGKLYVIDYKHGKGVSVDIEDNKQLHYYAVGAVNHFDVSADTDVCMCIIQPRAGGHTVKEQWKKAGDIHFWTNDLIAAAKMTTLEHAPLKEGGHCKWCPALARCPKVADNFFNGVARISLQDIRKKTKELTKPELLPIDDVIGIMESESLISKWLSACYDHLHALATKGDLVPGYKLVKKRTNRKWLNIDSVIQKFEHLGSLIFSEPELKSPAQLEKLKHPETKVALISKEEVASLCHSPESNDTTLVKDDDKREAVAGESVDEIFKNALNL